VELRWWWLTLLLLLVAGGWAWYVVRTWREEQRPGDGLLIAKLARIRGLPRYRAVVRQQMVQSAARVVAVAVVILGAVFLERRPTGEETEQGAARPGDLLLCLEASPQMYEENIAVLGQARSLAGQLDGERIGLMLFSDAAVTVMPLTDDYGYAQQRLHQAQLAFRNLAADTGAQTAGAKAGDGLVSCAQDFDRPTAERGRAVVLATGLPGAADPLYGVLEAGQVAADDDVVVYAVAPAYRSVSAAADLDQVATLTGGRLYDGAENATTRALPRVLREERDRLVPPPTTVRDDRPLAGTVLVLLGLGLVLGAGVRWPR
jgi:Ca-activated chloride channel family protein